MKKITLLLVIIFITTAAFSQRQPRKVEKAFAAQYPTASDIQWSADNDVGRTRYNELIWRAKYTIDGDSMASTYDGKANWLFTIIYIEIDELPDAVVKAIRDEYMRATITKAARMIQPDLESYGVIIEGSDLRMKIQLTEDGKVILRNLSTQGFD